MESMRKTKNENRKSMKLDVQTVRALSPDNLAQAGAGYATAGWSCCGDCTHSGFLSCINTSC